MHEESRYQLDIGRRAHNNVLFTVFSGARLVMQETHAKGIKSNGACARKRHPGLRDRARGDPRGDARKGPESGAPGGKEAPRDAAKDPVHAVSAIAMAYDGVGMALSERAAVLSCERRLP